MGQLLTDKLSRAIGQCVMCYPLAVLRCDDVANFTRINVQITQHVARPPEVVRHIPLLRQLHHSVGHLEFTVVNKVKAANGCSGFRQAVEKRMWLQAFLENIRVFRKRSINQFAKGNRIFALDEDMLLRASGDAKRTRAPHAFGRLGEDR